MKNLLVYACCGPCACHYEPFAEYTVGLYFNGDNFDTSDEYEMRRAAFETVSKNLYKNSRVFINDYNKKEFATCAECIGYRLRNAAITAVMFGYDCFTTTLTISPHKDTKTINEIGRAIGEECKIPFIEFDLKKNGGFQKSVENSKKLGIYRQKYCGCGK